MRLSSGVRSDCMGQVWKVAFVERKRGLGDLLVLDDASGLSSK